MKKISKCAVVSLKFVLQEGLREKGNISYSTSHLALRYRPKIREEQGVEMSGLERTCSD